MTAALLLVWPARAADRVEAKERKARLECAAGNYTEGVRLLAELWVSTGDPTYIYNQGRCYEQCGQNELAVSRFREYLRKAKRLSSADVGAINRHIDELEGQAAVRAAPPPTVVNLVQPAPAPPVASPAPTAYGAADRSTELVSPPPLPTSEPPVYARWWFWTGIGAVVVGGTVTAILVSRSGTKSPACDPGVPCVP